MPKARKKKGKKGAAPPPAGDANAGNGFVALPQDVHRVIHGCLGRVQRMPVAAAARALLPLYGHDDTVVKRALRHHWKKEKGSKSDAAAMGFVRRLPRLKQLEVCGRALLPYAASALGTGHYGQLTHVELSLDYGVGAPLAAPSRWSARSRGAPFRCWRASH